jgi:hypothetical protein
MKVDVKHLITMTIVWALSIYLVFYFTSCSAKWQINRAYKKGANLEQTSDTIRIASIDSFKVVLNDTFTSLFLLQTLMSFLYQRMI